MYGSNTNYGYAPMKVYGTFTPAATHNYFYGCTMQDGSTIDLSGRTGSWFTTGAFTSANSSNIVSFVEGATVTVNLADREDLRTMEKASSLVVAWTDGTAPASTVNFALDADTADKLYNLIRDDEVHGLKLNYIGGESIIIR